MSIVFSYIGNYILERNEVFMELDVQTIGKRIKERRKELNLTQLDIKDKVGISAGNISDIERGNRLPAAGTLVQLANVLDCTIDYILTGNFPLSENHSIPISEKSAHHLLDLFYMLSSDDQEELIMIAEMKVNKRKGREKSAFLENDNITSGIA